VSPFESEAFAVKVRVVSVLAFVALAARLTTGEKLPGKVPRLTTTSSDSGDVPPLPTGVM